MLHFFRSAAAATLILAATALGADAQPTLTPSPAAGSSPSPAPAPLAAPDNPPENPLVTARVRQEFLDWQSGRIDRARYSPEAGGTYADAFIKLVQPDLAEIGAPQTVTYRTTSVLLGDFVYRYEISGNSGVISVLYSLDGRGKTDTIVFTPKIFSAPTPAP
jgi:hypothetical protein